MNTETLLAHLRAALLTLESGNLPTPEPSEFYEFTICDYHRGGSPVLVVRAAYFRRAFAGREVDVLKPHGSSRRVRIATTVDGLWVETSIPLADVAPKVEIPTMPTTYTIQPAGGAS